MNRRKKKKFSVFEWSEVLNCNKCLAKCIAMQRFLCILIRYEGEQEPNGMQMNEWMNISFILLGWIETDSGVVWRKKTKWMAHIEMNSSSVFILKKHSKPVFPSAQQMYTFMCLWHELCALCERKHYHHKSPIKIYSPFGTLNWYNFSLFPWNRFLFCCCHSKFNLW